MVNKKNVAIGIGVVGLVVGGILLATRKARAVSPEEQLELPPGFVGPLTPEEIQFILENLESLVLSPEEELGIRQDFIQIMASPLVGYSDAVSPIYIPGTNTITVQGTNWRAGLTAWRVAIFAPTLDYDRVAPEDKQMVIANSWVWGTLGVPLDSSATFELPAGIVKSHIRIQATIGDMTTIIAQSGAFDVVDGMTIIYDDATRSFNIV